MVDPRGYFEVGLRWITCPVFRVVWLASRLAGLIPVELGRLVILKSLDISSNGLTGKCWRLPGTW